MNRVLSIVVLSLFVCLVSSPLMAQEAAKEWTYFVFLNADNNLDSFGVEDQKEMAKVGSNEWLNVVSLIDRENGPASLNYIEKGNVKLVKDMGELDMGDWKFLVQAFKDVAAAYPAKHYALVIWNHGSGWKNGEDIIKGISYDDSTNNHITTEQLGLAMAEIKGFLGRNLDIFCMDACLMQMMEVAYAVKDSTDFVVASEETEPGKGYPYDGMLGGMTKDLPVKDTAAMFVKTFAASYNGGTQGKGNTTQSAVECAKLDSLRDAIDGFCKAAMAADYGVQFKDALAKVQKFYYRTNVDLGHLNALLKTVIKDEAFQTASQKLEAAFNDVVASNGITGTTMTNAKGLAIYFPASSYSFSADYNNLAFAKDSLWEEMVQDFYKKTTTPTIVSDIENGDTSSLRSYVATANMNNREVSADVISHLNFRAFSEGGLTSSIQAEVSTLVKELKTK